ncbi:MAG: 50S ribosomal protein L24 [Candidatus Roizmanbacteria bacterium GW2011_GWA2_32_13]|uniref:Large ribosomal subunit protein uL24 n=1 Tax=Candidatus Roizmanbacteria bacterium GW2011_GWA2_32_13 TaxID=1618475 RepID=A0A0G0BBU1_9BACT|nr:MAG: 50S ribosomal protein L24 [Candidatus Roizmanbacteria bacterium GW2011_GWA2_32_13]
MKIKKGDKVRMTIGKDKGKSGVVEKVYKNANKVMVTGMNLYKKHVKKNEKMPQGGIVDLPRAINISKLTFVCPKCGKTAKLGFKIEKNKKYRICRKCDSKI